MATEYIFNAAPGETLKPADPPHRQKPHVSYGLAFTTACAHHAAITFHAKRIYVVISGSISKTPEWEKLQNALADSGREIVGHTAGGIDAHTPWHQVYELTSRLIETKPELILAVGGGSVADGVKLARLFAANGITTDEKRIAIWEKVKANFGGDQPDPADVKPASIPVINVPTTLSGGEWTQQGGATDKNNHKAIAGSSSMLSNLVIYDPALTLPVPPRFWLSTGVRAVDHLVEGLAGVVEVPHGDAVRDQFESALRMVLPALLVTKKDPKNLEARLQSMLATIPLPKAVQQCGGSHGIGHQLGPLGVGHGETSCILSPNVLKYNWKYGDELVRSRQERIQTVFWDEDAVAEVLKKKGLKEDRSDAGDAFDAYLRELGMPRSLKRFGIKREQFQGLAESSLKDAMTLNNPVKLDKKGVLEILEMAYNG